MLMATRRVLGKPVYQNSTPRQMELIIIKEGNLPVVLFWAIVL